MNTLKRLYLVTIALFSACANLMNGAALGGGGPPPPATTPIMGVGFLAIPFLKSGDGVVTLKVGKSPITIEYLGNDNGGFAMIIEFPKTSFGQDLVKHTRIQLECDISSLVDRSGRNESVYSVRQRMCNKALGSSDPMPAHEIVTHARDGRTRNWLSYLPPGTTIYISQASVAKFVIIENPPVIR